LSDTGSQQDWTRAERVTLFGGLALTTIAVVGTRLASSSDWVKVWDNVHWTSSYAAAAWLAVLSARRAQGPLRRTRRWFALAIGALFVGQLLWDAQVAAGWNPFPGPSDAFFVAMGPLLGVGVLSLTRGQSGARRLAVALDGVGLGLCVLALTLALYLPRRGDLNLFTLAVLAAYPSALLTVCALLVVVVIEIQEPPSAPLAALLGGILVQGLLWMKWNELTLVNGLGDGQVLNYCFSYGMLGLAGGVASYEPIARAAQAGLARAYHLVSRLLPLTLVVSASVAVALSTTAERSVQLAVTCCMAGVILVAVVRQSLLLEEGDRILQAEARSRALEDRLAQSQRLESLGTLASGIAHDFNNVLTAILGHIELLSRSQSLDDKARSSVEGVRAGATRARDVVRRILAFSRHEPTAAKAFDAAELVREVVALLRAALPARHALVIDAEGRPHLHGNPAQIHQVLMNLGTNASHAIGESPGTISFGVRARPAPAGPDDSPGHVELTVTDDGEGMEERTQARMFEPFFTTKARGEGTGLGLSVVHAIVTEHQGTIQVASKPGQGCRLRLLLPAACIPLESEAESTVVLQKGATISTGVALVVDDEAVIASLLVRLLEQLGQDAVATTSPDEAIELVRAEPARFAFVVSDMSMPAMSGNDLASALRAISPELLIVMSSGTDFALAGTQFDDVLPKPYTIGALAALLSRLRETTARSGYVASSTN